MQQLRILRWGRIPKITIALPASGNMTAANICSTLKYNIFKEHDSQKNHKYSKNTKELNKKMNQIDEAIKCIL